jgi:drug/metabolite transporter (DMT)-like permease
MNYRIFAIIAGILFGTGALMIKSFLNANSYLVLIFAIFLGLIGYGSLQFALKRGRGNITLIIALGISSVIAIFGGIFLLSEILTVFEIIGIVLVISGLVFLKY